MREKENLLRELSRETTKRRLTEVDVETARGEASFWREENLEVLETRVKDLTKRCRRARLNVEAHKQAVLREEAEVAQLDGDLQAAIVKLHNSQQ